MNKMIKGAAFAGVGVALLLGGGGTLATWNDQKFSGAGTITSGDLALNSQPGVWTDAADKPINVESYRVIPGETLKYTQTITPTLIGDHMVAELKVVGVPTNGFAPDSVDPKPVVLTNATGQILPDTKLDAGDHNEPITASTSFTFKDVSGRQDVGKTYDFSGVSYVLTQVPNN